jgi:hypothetical protein
MHSAATHKSVRWLGSYLGWRQRVGKLRCGWCERRRRLLR